MVMEQVEVVRAACCLAAADGSVSEVERAALAALAEQAGVGRMSLNAMIDMALTDQTFRDKQFGYISRDPEGTMKTLLRFAAADRDLSDGEKSLLKKFAAQLGITPDGLRAIVDSIRPPGKPRPDTSPG